MPDDGSRSNVGFSLTLVVAFGLGATLRLPRCDDEIKAAELHRCRLHRTNAELNWKGKIEKSVPSGFDF